MSDQLTRCPHGPKEPPYPRCRLAVGHEGPCDWSPTPAPPALDTLDFVKADRDAHTALGIPMNHWEASEEFTAAYESALNAQCAALVQQAREEEREKWAPAIHALRGYQLHPSTANHNRTLRLVLPEAE